jgi:hypothetical protein
MAMPANAVGFLTDGRHGSLLQSASNAPPNRSSINRSGGNVTEGTHVVVVAAAV